MRKVIGLFAAGVLGILIGSTMTWVDTVNGASDVVTFNEGFADSKLDDCRRGFAPACDWLNAK